MAELPMSSKFTTTPEMLDAAGEIPPATLLDWGQQAHQRFFAACSLLPGGSRPPRISRIEADFSHPVTAHDEVSLILSIRAWNAQTLTLRVVYWSERQFRGIGEAITVLQSCDSAGQPQPWPEVTRGRIQDLHFDQCWSED